MAMTPEYAMTPEQWKLFMGMLAELHALCGCWENESWFEPDMGEPVG